MGIAAFIGNSALLGVGLAMDAFSVSMANGLANPGMGRGERLRIAGTFALFQFLMPMIGWVCVRTVTESFRAFERLIPWIALILLGWIGGRMLWEGLRGGAPQEAAELGHGTLLTQGVATSIDALSVGFTIAAYDLRSSTAASLIIAAVTLGICIAGVHIGRRFGTRLAGKATALGGIILIAIGLEMFLKNLQ